MNTSSQFFFGLLAPFHGMQVFRQSARVRRLLLWTVLSFVVIFTIFQFLFGALVSTQFMDFITALRAMLPDLGWFSLFLSWILTAGIVIMGWVLSLAVSWAIMRLLLAFLLSFMAEKILQEMNLPTPGADQILRTLLTGLKRAFLLLLISLPFAILLLIPGLNLVAIVAFALILAADQMDFAMEALGWSLAERWAFLRRHPAAWLGMAGLLMILSLIPFLGLFLLPFTVAGGTLLVARLSTAK